MPQGCEKFSRHGGIDKKKIKIVNIKQWGNQQ